MLLIRNLHSIRLISTLALSERAFYTIIKTPSQTSKQMSIAHILKVCSSRKCTTAQDANFCSLMFDLMSKHSNTSEKQQQAMLTQITRMVSNSLKYMPELSLAETLLLANNMLRLIQIRRIKIKPELVTSFVELTNKNVSKVIDRDQQGKFFKQLIIYVERLMFFKKYSNQVKEIMDYLIKQVKSEDLVLQMLKKATQQYISRYKSYSKRTQYQQFNPCLQKVSQQMKSCQKLQLKQPYNCYPRWLFQLLLKMQQKYMNAQKYRISSTKQISFMKYYLRFMNQTILISENALSVEHVRFVASYLQKISNCFQYLEEEVSLQQKTKLWLGFQETLNQFVQKYSYLLKTTDGNNIKQQNQLVSDGNEWNSKTILGPILLNVYKKIYQKLLQKTKIKQLSQAQRQQFCSILSLYALQYCTMLARQRPQTVTLVNSQQKQLTNKLLKYFCNTYINIISQCTVKRKTGQIQPLESVVQYIAVLPYIVIMYQKCVNNNSNSKDMMEGVLKETLAYVDCLTDRNILQYYQPDTYQNNKNKSNKSTRSLSHNPIDFIGTINLVIKYLNFDKEYAVISKQLQQSIDRINLSLQISTYVDSPLLRIKQQAIEKTIMSKLNNMLKQRLQMKLYEKQSQQPKQMSGYIQRASQIYRCKTQYEQLLFNIFTIFKSSSIIKPQICHSLYYYWFAQNSQLMLNIFASNNSNTNYDRMQLAWELYRNSIRYLHSITSRSGVDFITEILRICLPTLQHRQGIQRQGSIGMDVQDNIIEKFKVIFNDRNVNNILYRKTDQITQHKYLWLITLLTDLITSLKLQQSPNAKQVMSYYKLIQLISFVAQDNRSTLYSKQSYLCNQPMLTLSQLMIAIIQKVDQRKIKLHNQQKNQKGKQNLLCARPIQQIIYYLTTANDPLYVQWIKVMDVSVVMHNLHDKYSKVQQYNILLSFANTNTSFKKSHDAFLNQQLMGQQLSQPSPNYRKSTVLKYYFCLLQPDRTQQSIVKSIQLISDRIMMTQKQVIEYWLSNNIVSKTKEPMLLQIMIDRLISDQCQLTYTQFITIVGNLITVLKAVSGTKYDKNDVKYIKLVQWIHSNMIVFSKANIPSYLPTSLKLLSHFPAIPAIHTNLHNLIKYNMKHNNIQAVEQLYLTFSKYQSTNVSFPWEQFMQMMRNVKYRGLCFQYYSLYSNTKFRVHVLVRAVTGLVLIQTPNHIHVQNINSKQNQQYINRLRQYIDEIFVNIQTNGIKQYLQKEENKNILYQCIIRHRIITKLLKQVPKCALSTLLQQLATIHEPQLQQHISNNQRALLQSNPKLAESYKLHEILNTQLTLIQAVIHSKQHATPQNIAHRIYINNKNEQQSDSEIILETIYIKIISKCSIQMIRIHK